MAKSKKRINWSKLILKAMLVFSAFYVTSTFYDQHKEMQLLKTQEASLLYKVQAKEKEVNDLKYQIENSNTDEHIEKIAREHLKMVKKDELIFIDLGKAPN